MSLAYFYVDLNFDKSKHKIHCNIYFQTMHAQFLFLIPVFMIFFKGCLWIKLVLFVFKFLNSIYMSEIKFYL